MKIEPPLASSTPQTKSCWLRDGNVWEIERPELSVEVHFNGKIQENWTENGLKIEQKIIIPSLQFHMMYRSLDTRHFHLLTSHLPSQSAFHLQFSDETFNIHIGSHIRVLEVPS